MCLFCCSLVGGSSVVPAADAVEQAVRMKQELPDAPVEIGDRLPPNTLDQLIDALGGTDNVAEVRIISNYYTPCTTKLLGGILVSLRPSVRPSIRPASRDRSVVPTVLVGSISYLMHLIKQLQKVCCMWSFSHKILKFEILAIFLNL